MEACSPWARKPAPTNRHPTSAGRSAVHGSPHPLGQGGTAGTPDAVDPGPDHLAYTFAAGWKYDVSGVQALRQAARAASITRTGDDISHPSGDVVAAHGIPCARSTANSLSANCDGHVAPFNALQQATGSQDGSRKRQLERTPPSFAAYDCCRRQPRTCQASPSVNAASSLEKAFVLCIEEATGFDLSPLVPHHARRRSTKIRVLRFRPRRNRRRVCWKRWGQRLSRRTPQGLWYKLEARSFLVDAVLMLWPSAAPGQASSF